VQVTRGGYAFPARPNPGASSSTDQALRSFAGFLLERAPDVTIVNQVTRRHIEDYKPWPAARPGQNRARVSTATLAHRLGTLRMFFVSVIAGAAAGSGCVRGGR